MVHADASDFGEGLSKVAVYEQLLASAEGLFDGQRNWVCNLSNTASLLWHAYHSLPAPSSAVNWAGFYVLDPRAPPSAPRLILGPFHGKVACQTIPFGRGVCGAAAATGETQLVRDVSLFGGHIACDGASRSEIVVPVFAGGKEERGGGSREEGEEEEEDEGEGRRLVAVIDVDCAVEDGFDEVDRVWVERLADLVGRSCDW